MTFGSLFSGIGGMDLGLERAGMECRWQVEIDPFCNRVLEKHWPHVRRYGDIRTVGGELERVDLIAGGFPCQDVSIAGLKRGIAKIGSSLRWCPEYIREALRTGGFVNPGWIEVLMGFPEKWLTWLTQPSETPLCPK